MSPPGAVPGTKEVFKKHLWHEENGFEVKSTDHTSKKEDELVADLLVLCSDGAQLIVEKKVKG